MARKIIFILMFVAAIVSSCGHGSEESRYSDILKKPTFARLTDSIRQNPSDPGLYYRRGLLLDQNDYKMPALADFETAWSLQKKEEYAIHASSILMATPDSGMAFLNKAIGELPGSVGLKVQMVDYYVRLQQVDKALAACNEILKDHPDQVGLLMIKSDLLDQKNDTVGSLKSLEQAYQLAPNSEELCYDLAFKYAQNEDHRTVTLCDSLLKNDSIGKKPEPWYFKGVYFSNLADDMKALDCFNRAIENDYNFLDAYMEKGQILFNEKKYKAGLDVFQLAAKVSPTYADAYYWLAKCQQGLGQKEDAKANYERAYGLDHSLTDARDAADKL